MTSTQSPPHITNWRYMEDCVIQDMDGNILHNAFQQDVPVIRQTYSDGTIVVLNSKTGVPILPPFKYDIAYNIIPVDGFKLSYMIETTENPCPTSPTPSSPTTDTPSTTHPITERTPPLLDT